MALRRHRHPCKGGAVAARRDPPPPEKAKAQQRAHALNSQAIERLASNPFTAAAAQSVSIAHEMRVRVVWCRGWAVSRRPCGRGGNNTCAFPQKRLVARRMPRPELALGQHAIHAALSALLHRWLAQQTFLRSAAQCVRTMRVCCGHAHTQAGQGRWCGGYQSAVIAAGRVLRTPRPSFISRGAQVLEQNPFRWQA